ncbi:family 1 glycosylhydrolase [Ramlibacter algicola]|uniref:Family 1 glycosylhydrolase n=1 Tax=Ramlibacter algicola TaxID=2795217 RepID=A0A934PXS5_9BURK|nr:family 1 glycosylhydrolase [Ramlibacter algicola]MBK0392449.1 family 1 glycosylhydrolase [Ramlibacter algicola]
MTTTTNALELWGGYECTVNRVGDAFHDQTLLGGHQDRIGDLELFAGLGLKSLRYPALWERMAPSPGGECDFQWTDERLPELRRLGINPILTLCHHGSGPAHTSLLEDSFATGLAQHAAAVAERYPWVRDYTPVNEPLTTARFSALYGFWYPHARDERLCWIALLNEIDATRLAMREIRRVNPEARLVQTDDLGYCHATPPLQEDADFQNERRWLGWDLLCGRVVPGHALWDRLCAHGLEGRLRRIAGDPCPPDVVGINHYLSSERLVDHRIERYGHRSIADRAVGSYKGVPLVDVDAIRHRDEGVVGLPNLLRQAWDRYRLPVAVTECHNGATRDEQVRWFVEVWRSAQQLRDEGVDLRAVTAWALLGSYDWNRMVTHFVGHYEPGVFDVRDGNARPTRMATVLQDLAAGRDPAAPALEVPGWWRRPSRLVHAAHTTQPCFERTLDDPGEGAPLLLVGDDGPLSHLAVRACEVRGLPYVRCGEDLRAALDRVRRWAVLDARDREGLAGPKRRAAACPHGPRTSVARVCAEAGVPCALFTSAFGPGLAAEGLSLPGVLVARTGPVYVPWDGGARAVRLLEALEGGGPVYASAHAWHEVYGPDLLDGMLDLLLDGASGAYNFFPAEGWTEAEWVDRMAHVAECDTTRLHMAAAPAEAPPAYPGGWTVSYLPRSDTTLERFVREARLARREGEAAIERKDDDVRLEDATGS